MNMQVMPDGAITRQASILMFTTITGAGEALVGDHLGFGTTGVGAVVASDGAGTVGTIGAGAVVALVGAEASVAGAGTIGVGAEASAGEVTELGVHLMATTMATTIITTEDEIMLTIKQEGVILVIPTQ